MSFKNWSMREVNEFNARTAEIKTAKQHNASHVGEIVSTEKSVSGNQIADGDEWKLHEFIIAECKRRGWIVFHGSMAHQTFRTKGEPDFVILARTRFDEVAKTFLIECKTRTGKITPDQAAIIHWAKSLGHIIHVVRSEAEFLEVVK